MSVTGGFVTAAAELGLQAIQIRPQRGLYEQKGQKKFDPIVAQAIIEEEGSDELEIVDHPVEQGSMISDHAFKKPAHVTVRYMWSNSPSAGSLVEGLTNAVQATGSIPQSVLAGNSVGQANAIYKQLLKLQSDRTLFNLFTGKRTYDNMMLLRVQVRTDGATENSLSVVAEMRQIIIAITKVATLGDVAAEKMLNPTATLSPIELGDNTLGLAPALSNSINAMTGGATNAINSLSTGLEQGVTALQSAVAEAIPALNAIAADAATKLPGVMEGFSTSMIDSANSLTGAIAGASGALPGIVTDAIANIQQAISEVGIPFEIPLTPTPQTFLIPLGSGT